MIGMRALDLDIAMGVLDGALDRFVAEVVVQPHQVHRGAEVLAQLRGLADGVGEDSPDEGDEDAGGDGAETVGCEDVPLFRC